VGEGDVRVHRTVIKREREEAERDLKKTTGISRKKKKGLSRARNGTSFLLKQKIRKNVVYLADVPFRSTTSMDMEK